MLHLSNSDWLAIILQPLKELRLLPEQGNQLGTASNMYVPLGRPIEELDDLLKLSSAVLQQSLMQTGTCPHTYLMNRMIFTISSDHTRQNMQRMHGNPSPVDELDDFLKVPHAAAYAAHAVLQDLAPHSSLGLGHLALLVQVLQQEPHKLNDGNNKRTQSGRPYVVPVTMSSFHCPWLICSHASDCHECH